MSGRIVFCKPAKTIPVSVTGTRCELNCPHCDGQYLRHMRTPQTALSLARSGRFSSVLLSGGCDASGRVLTADHAGVAQSFRDLGLRVNAHSGLLSAADMQALLPHIDVWSVDFISDSEVTKIVNGYDPGQRHLALMHDLLAAGAKVVPHVCVGINAGLPSGEEESIDQLAALGAHTVALLAFIPAVGTPLASCPPPPVKRVTAILERAVRLFGGGSVTLGCMRPAGEYRRDLDVRAVEAGTGMIVSPHPAAVHRAQQLGLEIEWRGECCAL